MLSSFGEKETRNDFIYLVCHNIFHFEPENARQFHRLLHRHTARESSSLKSFVWAKWTKAKKCNIFCKKKVWCGYCIIFWSFLIIRFSSSFHAVLHPVLVLFISTRRISKAIGKKENKSAPRKECRARCIWGTDNTTEMKIKLNNF